MNSMYYVAGIPFSDELYHHGIKGQKWGVRRFQNADGTLTSAGKARYGDRLGEYAKGKQSLGRRIVTGDWALGNKRIGERIERNYSRRIDKRKAEGKDTSRLERKRDVWKERNVSRDIYASHTSTGKMLVQNLLTGSIGANYMSDSYRSSRARGRSRVDSLIGSALGTVSGVPVAALIYDSYDASQSVKSRR